MNGESTVWIVMPANGQVFGSKGTAVCAGLARAVGGHINHFPTNPPSLVGKDVTKEH